MKIKFFFISAIWCLCCIAVHGFSLRGAALDNEKSHNKISELQSIFSGDKPVHTRELIDTYFSTDNKEIAIAAATASISSISFVDDPWKILGTDNDIVSINSYSLNPAHYGNIPVSRYGLFNTPCTDVPTSAPTIAGQPLSIPIFIVPPPILSQSDTVGIEALITVTAQNIPNSLYGIGFLPTGILTDNIGRFFRVTAAMNIVQVDRQVIISEMEAALGISVAVTQEVIIITPLGTRLQPYVLLGTVVSPYAVFRKLAKNSDSDADDDGNTASNSNTRSLKGSAKGDPKLEVVVVPIVPAPPVLVVESETPALVVQPVLVKVKPPPKSEPVIVAVPVLDVTPPASPILVVPVPDPVPVLVDPVIVKVKPTPKADSIIVIDANGVPIVIAVKDDPKPKPKAKAKPTTTSTTTIFLSRFPILPEATVSQLVFDDLYLSTVIGLGPTALAQVRATGELISFNDFVATLPYDLNSFGIVDILPDGILTDNRGYTYTLDNDGHLVLVNVPILNGMTVASVPATSAEGTVLTTVATLPSYVGIGTIVIDPCALQTTVPLPAGYYYDPSTGYFVQDVNGDFSIVDGTTIFGR